MIYQLKNDDYENVRPLFQELGYHLTIQAVIDGLCPGRVYADDIQRPKSALVYTAEGCFLAGTPENAEFNMTLCELIRRIGKTGDTVRIGENAINLDMRPQSWNAVVAHIFPDRAPLIEQRRQYLCTELRVNWRDMFPDGYAVQRIDQDFLEQPDITIPGHIHGWIQANWGSREHFLQHGFGFSLIHEQQVVSWSVADCVSGDRCEIGIHTLPGYRQRGLATVTVVATVDFCFSHGFKSVGWHCNDDNIGSWKTAEKAGFFKEREYMFYLYLFDNATHLAETGWRCVKAKRYQTAVDAFRQVFALKNDAPHFWYHSAAMAYAGLGDSETALSYLLMIAERDWPYADFTEHCEEFAVLRETPEWRTIITRMQKQRTEYS